VLGLFGSTPTGGTVAASPISRENEVFAKSRIVAGPEGLLVDSVVGDEVFGVVELIEPPEEPFVLSVEIPLMATNFSRFAVSVREVVALPPKAMLCEIPLTYQI
jgi:hypothetical protein